MSTIDPLAAARGLLVDLLDHRKELPGAVSLDVCAALNELDLSGQLPTYPPRMFPPRSQDYALREARAAIRAAIPDLPEPGDCRQAAAAIGYLDAALAGLAAL